MGAMRGVVVAVVLALAGPAMGQGLQVPGLGGGSGGGLGGALGNIPGLGNQPETPEQKRAFCQRVGGAVARCQLQAGLSVDMVGLTSCVVRALPPQDSLRVAQVANSARGNASALMSECGIGLGR